MAKVDAGYLNHLVSVRMRVKGVGNLKTTVYSLDDVINSSLPNIAMLTTTDKLPTILSNFKNQKMQIEVKVTEIDEYFIIGRIIVFVKPVSTGYPQ